MENLSVRVYVIPLIRPERFTTVRVVDEDCVENYGVIEYKTLFDVDEAVVSSSGWAGRHDDRVRIENYLFAGSLASATPQLSV